MVNQRDHTKSAHEIVQQPAIKSRQETKSVVNQCDALTLILKLRIEYPVQDEYNSEESRTLGDEYDGMNDNKSEQDDVQQNIHSESPSNEWLKLDMLDLSVIKNIVTLRVPDECLIIMMSKAKFDYIVPNDRDP
jgi:hypothetical protein